ncbi:MAG TPA: DUF6531 domain-containing protein [Solirubrobacteraceae bacterium]|nr:DUF6531 domain-containing protein [Solirubrobacteraceae bacterium]
MGAPLGSRLVVSEAQPLLGGEAASNAEAAQLANPEAAVARRESETKWEGLSAGQAAGVDREAFPALIDEPAGGPPKLPAGESMAGMLTDYAAQISLPDGRSAVLESLQPIALETSGGGHVPVDLGLSEVGGGFEPKVPVVGAHIPRQLSAGVSLAVTGVSLTPVSSSGAPVGGEGTLEGASVLYANTQTDTDTVVKPTTGGFEEDSVLRSMDSPSQLYYRVGLPAGARLLAASDGSGAVEVVKEGTTIATIGCPGAHDAVGTAVPVSMSVGGDVLKLSVGDGPGEYEDPIVVDPDVKGEEGTEGIDSHSNWEFYTGNGKGKKEPSNNFGHSVEGGKLKTYGVHEYQETEEAFWVDQTQGESEIYEFEGETEGSNKEDRIESIAELQYGNVKEEKGGITEYKELLSSEASGPVEYSKQPLPEALCPKGKGSCVPGSGHKENAVHFQQSVVGKPTSKYSFSDAIGSGTVYIAESEHTHSTTGYNTTSPKLEFEVENEKKEKVKEKRANVMDGGGWLSEFEGAIEFEAHDKGVGVSATRLEYESAPGKWEAVQGAEHSYLNEGLCKGVQCAQEQKEYWTLNPHLPNGEDKIRYRAEEAFGDASHETESLETEGTATVKVDTSKPRNIYVAGIPYGNELAEKTYELTAYATDGEGTSIPSSGIKSIELYVEVDGKSTSLKALHEHEGTCSVAKGECTASAKFEISGAELGAGHQTIIVVAKDNAGSEAREEESITIRHSTPVPMGPGSVDLESGDFALSATDVSQGGGLSVSRVYSSRDVTAGEGGSLGPQWSVSVGGQESLVEMPDKSVLVTSATGSQTVFSAAYSEGKLTGKYDAPPGDSNLTLTLEENAKKEAVAYVLKDAAENTSTTFTQSSVAKEWVPTKQEGAVPAEAVTYTYETVEVAGKKITRPSEALTEMPAKVSCAPKMEPGCRALKFAYATKTKSEIGEGPAEWGEYEGRLIRVSYEGYNPATKKMTATAIPVAEYAYDKQGRLRAEWDPRLAPHELKTTYGYDGEGHVTALTPPGQQPWLMRYGTTEQDASMGRLLSVSRPKASTASGEGVAPVESEAPKLSTTTPTAGLELSVTSGTWTHGALAYGYQWEDCNSSGTECTPIPGAVNPSYTPRESDENHELVVLVTATNAAGSTVAASTSSSMVPPRVFPKYSEAFGSKGTGREQFNSPSWDAIGGEYDRSVLVSDTGNNRILALGLSGGNEGEFGESEHIHGPTGIAATAPGSGDRFWVVDPGEKKFLTYQFPGRYEAGFSYKAAGEIGGMADIGANEEQAYQYLADTGANSILWRQNGSEVGTFGKLGSGNGQFKAPDDVAATGEELGGDIFVTDTGNDRVQKLKAFFGEYVSQFGSEGTGPGQFKEPKGIVVDSDGDVWVVDSGNDRLEEFTSNGVYLGSYGSAGSGEEQFNDPIGIAVDKWNELYVVDSGDDRIERWVPETTSLPLPPAAAPASNGNSVTTLDYNVPVSGEGAPHNMSASEVAKWGQKAEEAPDEATAISPPDSPQGWPASGYSRAAIYYMDKQGRVVNTATPSTGKYGSISTAEYNEYNDVGRTLSPDNRATALEAGEKSAEVASLLSTFNTYNSESKPKCSKESEFDEERESYEPGTRLCETEGPAHAVKYMAGKEQEKAPYARSHVRYFYDEKVPAEGPDKESFANQTFDLLTESKTLTEIVNAKGGVEQEVEPRTTVTSYSGQNNLGWKLRKPTSVTVAAEAEGAKITHTTLYNENGQPTETRGPEGLSGESAHDQKLIYYGAEENKEYKTCGEHREWAGLACETLPAKQPGTSGLPRLPDTTTTYNIWDQPETIEETFGGKAGEKTRTRKNVYETDSTGVNERLASSEVTSNVSTEKTDKALPKVTNEYNTTTGALEKQATTTGQTITSKYNTLGQIESYTDASGNVATFKYAGPENDSLLEEVTDGSDQGKSYQRYHYSSTTKQLSELQDSGAGSFTASYDTEGKLTSEVYPNGMCANYTYNSVGEASSLEYVKSSNCTEKSAGVWYSETKASSARGETMSRTSTLASEEYTYDTLARLTEVHETPTGEYCKTRIYAYDEESNRTSLTTREPNSKKECATEGGTVEKHTYDEANRLTDTGITYDPLGNITNLPAADAEGHTLESTFYVDNAVATQTQNGVTNDYYPDPDGRTLETITGSKKLTTHYDGAGEAIAWSSEGSGETEKWTRDIPGIDGTLTATQEGEGKTSDTAVLLLHDIEGDVVATIKDKTGETALLSKYNSTEFGAPNSGKEPPRYAWLGATGVERSLASGVITEGATSYVPQTSKPLQSEEVAPPGLPDGSGGVATTFHASPWNLEGAERVGAEAPGKEAGREREAEEAAIRACESAEGACGEDPSHTVYLTRERAYHLCDEIENVGSDVDLFLEVLGQLFDVDPITSLASLALDEDELFIGKSLEECAGELGLERGARCMFTVYTWRTEIQNPITWHTDHLEIFYGKTSVTSCWQAKFFAHEPTSLSCFKETTRNVL